MLPLKMKYSLIPKCTQDIDFRIPAKLIAMDVLTLKRHIICLWPLPIVYRESLSYLSNTLQMLHKYLHTVWFKKYVTRKKVCTCPDFSKYLLFG